MEEIHILEIVEKYLNGELTPEELAHFEQLRKSNPELDQQVVAQTMFYNKLNQYSKRNHFKSDLQDVHHHLIDTGAIKENSSKAVVLSLWRKYKRVMAVAASIAGVTTLLIAATVSYFTHVQNDQQLQQLRLEFKKEFDSKKREVLNEVDKKIRISKAPENSRPKSGGTGFLIDTKGFLVTNAHVVSNSSSVIVLNNKGDEFRADIISVNTANDIAILKINDEDFKNVRGPLPYSLRKAATDLGEPLFTLGYPRNEIVYNEGYMSAKTGFKGDTLSCQIGVPANPGNSGGPVFNKNGEIIGIINTRLLEAEGVVFAVNSRSIINELSRVRKENESANQLKYPNATALRGIERPQQIRKIKDYIYMVKSY